MSKDVETSLGMILGATVGAFKKLGFSDEKIRNLVDVSLKSCAFADEIIGLIK